ncbi:MAG: alpha-L-arabinofuranosidase [Bacteroidaceae bacterium]|nr:alpha-L-arabinofuranosidase [Bacteroidaceae bacterium]
MRKAIVFFGTLMCFFSASAQTAPIRIDLQQKGAVVSPNLYGIFFEEINHAGDGGLYAELVQNRGFEEHVLPSGMTLRDGKAWAPDAMNYEHRRNRNWNIPWNVEEKKMTGWRVAGEQATVKGEVIEAPQPLHQNTPHAMQLTIKKVQQGGKAVLTNTGYWGMGFKAGEKYDLRCYVKSSNYKGSITARLVDTESGASLGKVEFKDKQLKEWTELTATLTAEGTAAKGALALEFDQKGTVLVDYVSLFPQATFKGRKNGQRADVAQMLVDLHPKFMRWPGGCIVEGATYENRVKWKETLGDPMTRRGEWDLWGYRATWGMGYHEFLQFCEDLGMDAMFVDNAGMSCSVRNGDFVSSDADMDAVVQDFRDAIDYALADPATNKWAKMRAEAGHPKPFPLKYVEIGNENVGPEYVTHFNYIFKRLKAEYPQVIFINTLGHTDPLLERIPGEYMVDPHWYRNPDFFFANNHLFDDAPRTHDIYVGEYACNGGVGAGNLLAALSEAAFILGMERNSDVVKMSSYAPLFENENRRDWPCNLIHINSAGVYGRASYYVQQMAAEHRPTYNIYVSEPTTAAPAQPFAAGGIGLGSYATQCEYKDISVTTADGRTAQYRPDQLTTERGQWQVEGEVLRQTSDARTSLAMLPATNSDNYTLTLKARKTGGMEGFFIFYSLDEKGRSGYGVNIGGWNNQITAVQPMRGGRLTDVVSPRVRQSVETGRWYDVKLVVTPMAATLFVDGKEITVAKPAEPTRHFCQTGFDEQTGELVIKVVNGTEQPYSRSFVIDGARNVMPTGRVITLSGNAQDENTFEEPTKLAPVETRFGKFGRQFQYEFPPMSFTIMRVKVSR